MLKYSVLILSLGLLSSPTCDGGVDGTPNPSSDCEACLESGGTWQPEASQCTENCAIQDISCFVTTCPGECEESCSDCFSQSECEAADCTWHQEAEAMWCTD